MIAVDIGGSHITSVHIKDLATGKMSTKLRRDLVPIKGRCKEAILNVWAKNINDTINTSDSFNGQIAIAIPGPFNYEEGIIETHPNGKFKPLKGVHLRNELSSRINGCEQIHFENDAASFGLGEYFYGSIKPNSKIIALTIGSGIGCTFLDNGKVIRNRTDVPQGGEIYHLSYKELSADEYFSTRWFVSKSEAYGLAYSGVKQLIEEGNEDIKNKIFDEFVFNLFEFLSPIALKFETDVIIIGGNISKSWSYFGSELNSKFKSINIVIKQSKFGEKAICLGAAISMHNLQKG